jgi:hypothetical protein
MRASLVLASASLVIGCGDTYNIPGPSTGAGGTSATSGDQQTSAPSSSSGPMVCGAGEKECDESCASINDPATGCGRELCFPCPTPHAVALCANQECAVDKCVGTWRDCDGEQINGCESDLTVDPQNCGGCGIKCVLPGASIGVCVAGECSLGPCLSSQGNCDGVDVNGCESSTSIDPQNCGKCAVKCATGLGCDEGTCHACGREFNYGTTATSLIPTSKWLAYKYVPSHNEHTSQVCIKGGSPGTSYNMYVMSDSNGPGAVLSKSTAFHAPSYGVGIACTPSGTGWISADLVAGNTYWIAGDVFAPPVNVNGEQIEYYISGSIKIDATTLWYPGSMSGPPWTGFAGIVAKVTASCN